MPKFKEMKATAIENLEKILGHDVENSAVGVNEAYRKAYKSGKSGIAARVYEWVTRWIWADCEEWYHAMPSTSAK